MKNNYKYLILNLLLFVTIKVNGQSTLWTNTCHPDVRATYGVSFSQDGSQILSGSECHEARIRIFDALNGTILWDYLIDTTLFCVQGVKFSAGAQYIGAIEETGNFLLFDNTVTPPTLAGTIPTGTFGSLSASFNPSGTKVAIGCSSNLFKIFNVPSGTLVSSISAHTGFVWSISYSADGTKIATGGDDNKAKIWDSTGVLIHNLNGHTGDVLGVDFSNDGSILATGSRDDKIKIWNVASGTLISTLTGHTGDINCVDISPNGQFVASGSSDSTLRIWDLNTGQQIGLFSNPNGGFVYSVNWSPLNNYTLVLGNGLGEVISLDVQSITSINETSNDVANNISIYPNPVTNGLVKINIENVIHGVKQVSIFDINGKVIQSIFTFNNQIVELNTSNFSKGIYFVNVIGNDNIVRASSFNVN
jgi:WD40 repeat protein